MTASQAKALSDFCFYVVLVLVSATTMLMNLSLNEEDRNVIAVVLLVVTIVIFLGTTCKALASALAIYPARTTEERFK